MVSLRANLTRQGARWIHAGAARGRVQAIRRARNEDVPFHEPAEARRAVGRRTDSRRNGEVPLAQTATGRDD